MKFNPYSISNLKLSTPYYKWTTKSFVSRKHFLLVDVKLVSLLILPQIRIFSCHAICRELFWYILSFLGEAYFGLSWLQHLFCFCCFFAERGAFEVYCIVHRQCLFKRTNLCLGHCHRRLFKSNSQKKVSLLVLWLSFFSLPLSFSLCSFPSLSLSVKAKVSRRKE